MLTDYENKRLKLNKPLRGKPAGAVIPIRTDKNGTPQDPYWRRRLKDAETDGCVEIIKETKKAKKAETIRKGE